MKTTAVDRFPATLNPTAQEFRPTHTYTFHAPPPSPPSAYRPPLPSRTLLLSSVAADVSESIVRRDLEVFGDVRAVQMENRQNGVVLVHFYDIRQSTKALHAIQEQHMQQQCRLREQFDRLRLSARAPACGYEPKPAPGLVAGRAVWAEFSYPVHAGVPDGYNQGTIVVFNLESDVSDGTLKEIFEAFGPIKELRETPLKKTQRFIEFYDTRDASKALANTTGKEISGKQVVVEFSHLGGQKNAPKGNKSIPIAAAHPPPIILTRKLRPLPRRRLKTKSPEKQVAGKKSPEKHGGGVWSKQWKGLRQTKGKYDPRFLIKEDGVISESGLLDSRTTVMIKNIPNKYSQKLLLNMLDNHCIHCNEQIDGDDVALSSYDFVYLPIDFKNKCNVGYGFVNMTSPEATRRLYKAFHLQNWEVFNSKKICEVSYARLQGLEALTEHFKNSRFPCEAEEYMPVMFTPPRDGRRLTDPTPIVGRLDHGSNMNNNGISSNNKNNNNVRD